jgi:hypothetical protein
MLAKEKLTLDLAQATERSKHELDILKERSDLEMSKQKMAMERQISVAIEREQEAVIEAEALREKNEKLLHQIQEASHTYKRDVDLNEKRHEDVIQGYER